MPVRDDDYRQARKDAYQLQRDKAAYDPPWLPMRTCAYTSSVRPPHPIPNSRRASALYCSPKCQQAAYAQRKRYEKKASKSPLKWIPEIEKVDAKQRRGQIYAALLDNMDLVEKYRAGVLTAEHLAVLFKTDRTSVDSALMAIAVDEMTAEEQKEWPGPPQEALDALESFKTFRDRYFLTETGEPFDTAPFHLRWISALTDTMTTGGRLMILSPPRHGKTQLLIHFCIWQIVRNPHIRIAWIAGNRKIAFDWLASIEEELENNQQLNDDFLPPYKSFRPPTRSRLSWSREQFTVATRTRNVKSPTMVALGRGSKVLSRDVDLIIADDIEDHASTLQPNTRENTRNWWTTSVGSRKLELTGQVVIGSRQHPDDIYGHLMSNEAWEVIVETAHDEATCVTDPTDYDAHVDCMLWPEYRSYRWLMDMLADAETTGGRGMWEMVYLNHTSATGLQIFTKEPIDRAKNPNRDLFEYPTGAYLLAGLDPSATGYQASFLWAVELETRKLYMVDLENHEGGGIAQARRQIEWWFDGHPTFNLYCRHWVVEENLYRGGIVTDEILTRYCHDNAILLEPHTTGTNKWDPHMGVTTLASRFSAGLIDLPYASPEAQAKTDAFVRQCLGFNQLSGRRQFKSIHSDIVMAAWFPTPQIQHITGSRTHAVTVGYQPSYTGWTRGASMFSYSRRG